MVDRDKELLAKFTTMMTNKYRILCIPISTRNPQANTIVEREYQTFGNIIPTFKIQQMDLDNEKPMKGMCLSYSLQISLLRSIHCHHWYLVGT